MFWKKYDVAKYHFAGQKPTKALEINPILLPHKGPLKDQSQFYKHILASLITKVFL